MTAHIEIPFDQYHDYDAMTGYLRELAAGFPSLMTLTSLGSTHRGRDIWAVTLTSRETGPVLSKPGYYLDAQIHAEEHATSAAALYTIWYLLHSYGSDADVTRLLDEQAVYVLPRINPDGTELSLNPPYVPWCGNGRLLPGEERENGLIPEDIDGDGFIASMRVPAADGEWKISGSDPRQMVLREPGEHGGQYYRLYPEGHIRNYDGVNVLIEKPRDGNLNRDFPANWSNIQYGAYEKSLSEPESRAVADFILNHPNIAGINSLHTHGGVILRPSMTEPDSAMAPRDLALYQEIGRVGEKITGYPVISIFEDFTPDKSKPRFGGLMDWTYGSMGIVSFALELWDVFRAAGAVKQSFYNIEPATTEARDRIFNWVVDNTNGMGFRDWKPFDHPQLGPVEIGGPINIWAYRNPPAQLLEGVCHATALFCVHHALAAPRVRIERISSEPLSEGMFRVTAVVANHGYLPTNLTDIAISRNQAKPVIAELLPVEGCELETQSVLEVGHLAGRNERRAPWSPWGPEWSNSSAEVSWLVAGSAGAAFTVRIRSQRAGSDSQTSSLGKTTENS